MGEITADTWRPYSILWRAAGQQHPGFVVILAHLDPTGGPRDAELPPASWELCKGQRYLTNSVGDRGTHPFGWELHALHFILLRVFRFWVKMASSRGRHFLDTDPALWFWKPDPCLSCKTLLYVSGQGMALPQRWSAGVMQGA